MKTAEEYTENSGMASEYGYSVKVMPVCDVLIVMKQYARKVAEQTLKDAAERIRDTDSMYDALETPIITP